MSNLRSTIESNVPGLSYTYHRASTTTHGIKGFSVRDFGSRNLTIAVFFQEVVFRPTVTTRSTEQHF